MSTFSAASVFIASTASCSSVFHASTASCSSVYVLTSHKKTKKYKDRYDHDADTFCLERELLDITDPLLLVNHDWMYQENLDAYKKKLAEGR